MMLTLWILAGAACGFILGVLSIAACDGTAKDLDDLERAKTFRILTAAQVHTVAAESRRIRS